LKTFFCFFYLCARLNWQLACRFSSANHLLYRIVLSYANICVCSYRYANICVIYGVICYCSNFEVVFSFEESVLTAQSQSAPHVTEPKLRPRNAVCYFDLYILHEFNIRLFLFIPVAVKVDYNRHDELSSTLT